jgi:hypothetical protein
MTKVRGLWEHLGAVCLLASVLTTTLFFGTYEIALYKHALDLHIFGSNVLPHSAENILAVSILFSGLAAWKNKNRQMAWVNILIALCAGRLIASIFDHL